MISLRHKQLALPRDRVFTVEPPFQYLLTFWAMCIFSSFDDCIIYSYYLWLTVVTPTLVALCLRISNYLRSTVRVYKYIELCVLKIRHWIFEFWATRVKQKKRSLISRAGSHQRRRWEYRAAKCDVVVLYFFFFFLNNLNIAYSKHVCFIIRLREFYLNKIKSMWYVILTVGHIHQIIVNLFHIILKCISFTYCANARTGHKYP